MNIKNIHNKDVLRAVDTSARVLAAKFKAAEMWLAAEFPTVTTLEILEDGLINVGVEWPKTASPNAAPFIAGQALALFNEHGGFVRFVELVAVDKKSGQILVSCPPIASPVEGPDISAGDFLFQLP